MFKTRGRRQRAGAASRPQLQTGSQPLSEEQRQLFTYEMLTLQALEEHAHMWQTPTLGLTAQAFLFTVSLDSTVAPASRALAAGLGAVVALLSLQLMIRHQFHLNLDRAQLRHLEKSLGLIGVGRREWGYDERRRYSCELPGAPRSGWAQGLRSTTLWKWGLSTFALADLAVLAVIASTDRAWFDVLTSWT